MPKFDPMRTGMRQFKMLQPQLMYSLLKNLLSNFHLFPSRNLKTCSEKRKPSCLVPVDVENVGTREISFSGDVQNYCVCFIDIIGSTKISSTLTPTQLSRYYELFLNAIALIARNFRAKIVKNAGDALIFYFNDTSDPKHVIKFKNVLDCGLTMGIASNALNAKMLSEKLPPIKYRISADYG